MVRLCDDIASPLMMTRRRRQSALPWRVRGRRGPLWRRCAYGAIGQKGGGGAAVAAPYRVEVTARHGQPKPWGWQVFRRGATRPIERSVTGYANEADAWSAGGSVVTRLEKADR
jgi:hypothetical protein